MFLYWFVCRCRSRHQRRCHRPQTFVHAITFEQLVSFWLIFVVTLTSNFEGQIWNLLYLSQKWPDCHETKSKHIDWTLGPKCDHKVWPWPWPWPWFFKVKYVICYISAKNGSISTQRKANILIELQASNVTNGFDLGIDHDLLFFKVKCDLDSWPRIFMVKFFR